MWYVLVVGIVLVIFGLLLLFKPKWLGAFLEVFNKGYMFGDMLVNQFRLLFGLILLFLSAWMVRHVFLFPEMGVVFYPACLFFAFFGMIMIFFPTFMSQISAFLNRVIFHTDSLVLKAHRAFGLLFILIGLYLIYASCLFMCLI
jgi:hypothetical protein